MRGGKNEIITLRNVNLDLKLKFVSGNTQNDGFVTF